MIHNIFERLALFDVELVACFLVDEPIISHDPGYGGGRITVAGHRLEVGEFAQLVDVGVQRRTTLATA